MLAGKSAMLPTGAASSSHMLERPAGVGSLFVPSRVAPRRAPKPQLQQQDCPSTVCRIASLERTPQPRDPFDQIMQSAATAPQQQQQQQQRRQEQAAPQPTLVKERVAGTTRPALSLSWAGSGIYFWWQLGAVQYLMERYDLSKVPHIGASGGALCAVIAACGVDPQRVMESAYALSLHHNIWEKPMGLLGVWGSIIEKWLHDTLPDDAHERCSGKVGILVTELPSCRQVVHDQFTDKADLINCAMASAHVPILLDWKLSRPCRGKQCVDGSFPDFFYGNCDLISSGVLFDYFDDTTIIRNGRMDMLQLKHYTEIQRIMKKGYRYAAKLEREGKYTAFDCSEVLKKR